MRRLRRRVAAGGRCGQDLVRPSTTVPCSPAVLMVLVPLVSLLGQRVPLPHDVLLSCSCVVSSGAGTDVLGNLDTGSGEGACALGARAALPFLL